MNFATGPGSVSAYTVPRDSAVIVLLLAMLWISPHPAPAGELSGVPAMMPPVLSLPDIAGRQRSLDEFSGKVVLVSFWASWCRPCIEEVPAIHRLIAAMADASFAVVAVNVGETERRVQAAVTRLGIDFPVLLDEDGAAFEAWGADVLPAAYILDPAGRLRYIGQGPVAWDRAGIQGMLVQLAQQAPDGN